MCSSRWWIWPLLSVGLPLSVGSTRTPYPAAHSITSHPAGDAGGGGQVSHPAGPAGCEWVPAAGVGSQHRGHPVAPKAPPASARPQPVPSHAAQLPSGPAAEQCHRLVRCWAEVHNLCISWIFNWQPLRTSQSFLLFFLFFRLQCFAFPVSLLQMQLTCGLCVAIYNLFLGRMD